MPATVTHAYFSLDVYHKLAKKDQLLKSEHLTKLKMFGQSMDSMMFYNIENFRCGKKMRKFQYQFHTTNTQSFFICLCKYIRENQLNNNSEVLAFLYGFICHYVLDCTTHPYVIYKTGVMDKKRQETYRYNQMHTYMETFLDNAIIYRKTEKKPNQFRLDQFCFDLNPFSEDLNLLINSVFSDVFQLKNMAKIYFQSLKQMKRFLRRYRYDRFGVKYFGYQIIDFFTSRSTFQFKALSYHYSLQYKSYFLNDDHSIWYNPVDPTISSHASFFELYNQAIEEACFIIREVNRYLSAKNVLLEHIFKNKSYLSGLDCTIPLYYKKFSF